MKQTLQNIWKDPVWSKVIATVIWALLILIFNWLVARFKRKTLKEVLLNFFNYKIEFWIYIFGFIILFGLNSITPQFGIWNYILTASVIFIMCTTFYKSKNQTDSTLSKVKINGLGSKLFFSSNNAMHYFFRGNGEYYYENNKAIGKIGEGSLHFDDGILLIERTNTDGRLFIKLLRYISDGGYTDFIKNDISNAAIRIINIKFMAKVINSDHVLWFIAKKVNDVNWIHKANVKVKITNQSWKEYQLNFEIPATEDFEIYIDDREVQKAPSSIQIKDLLIEEVF